MHGLTGIGWRRCSAGEWRDGFPPFLRPASGLSVPPAGADEADGAAANADHWTFLFMYSEPKMTTLQMMA
jgi:hypothetical protein